MGDTHVEEMTCCMPFKGSGGALYLLSVKEEGITGTSRGYSGRPR
jgi:hypothetical protein